MLVVFKLHAPYKGAVMFADIFTAVGAIGAILFIEAMIAQVVYKKYWMDSPVWVIIVSLISHLLLTISLLVGGTVQITEDNTAIGWFTFSVGALTFIVHFVYYIKATVQLKT